MYTTTLFLILSYRSEIAKRLAKEKILERLIDLNHILKLIYKAVINKEKTPPLEKTTENIDINFRTDSDDIVIFLSVADAYSRAFVGMGKDTTFTSAIHAAYRKYKKNRPSSFEPISVKLDIVTDMQPAKSSKDRVNIKKDTVPYTRGKDGLALDSFFNAAFLPEEVVAYRMIGNKKLVPENIFNAYEKHSLLSNDRLVKKLLTSETLKLYKFQTKSYYIDQNGYTPLYRGHRMFSDLSKQDIWNAIALTKDNYFKNVVNTKGKYIYSYLPQENRNQGGYNILRHAGTTYSMLETYELMPDEELLQIAKNTIRYLLKKAKETEINGKPAQIIVEKDHVKLGGNALTILALAKYTKVTGDKQYLSTIQKMASWMVEAQKNDGRFSIHKQSYSTGKVLDFTSSFYPGEAIFSLVRLYQLDRNDTWLDAAEEAANYLINIRDKNASTETITFDHWFLYALNELYRERPKNMYLNHAFLMARAIPAYQITSEKENPDWIGGYIVANPPPKATQAACYSEGLSVSYNMALHSGYQKEAEEIKKTLDRGIQFQLQMQLRPESTMYYENKQLCLGAIQNSPTHYDLRNDYTQHNISSFIAYYNILNDEREN